MSQRNRAVVLYLHVHQPWRVRPYTVFDTASRHDYFNGHGGPADNETVFRKVADKSYRPMNILLLKMIEENPEFRVSFSITGTFIEQAERWAPDVLDQFRVIIGTGRAEIVAETYYHSLAFFFSRREFEAQVARHRDAVQRVFGVTPTVFRNTELAYTNSLAEWAETAGYAGILSEGWDPVLGWRSPNYAYRPAGTEKITLLQKNYKLSDDLAFRFSNKDWEEYPLTAEKYTAWLSDGLGDGDMVNLFMDYETFGEHQWADSGIFEFFGRFVREWLKGPHNTFMTAGQAATTFTSVGTVNVPGVITWADTERDLTAWLGNDMQTEAMRYIYDLEDDVLQSGDDGLVEDWRRLQTSDHVYYMCTKWANDGDVHAYFSPYDSPYDAFLYYLNAVRDLRYRVSEHKKYRFLSSGAGA